MTTKTQAVPRSGPPRRLPILLVSVLSVAALTWVGCAPDLPDDPVPSFFELQFDPSSSPPKSYEPTLLVTNADTGLLDFSAAGIVVPADPLECGTQTALPVAACEFYWYMQQLDGFPTLTPARTPVSAPIDLATVTLPGNLFVYEFMRGTAPITDGTVSYDAEAGYLKFEPAGGWDIGGLYLAAVRGYTNGIKDTDGNEAVKSIIYVLLQQDNPLTCGITDATDPALYDCGFYSLFSNDARFKDLPAGEKEATIFATLAQLEQLRGVYKGDSALPFDVWTQVEEKAQMPANEVGILWAFRTHTASVVELNPNTGLAPVVASPTEIHLTPKGPIDATTLKAFSLTDPTGDVFLLDGTAFLGGDFLGALPTFTVAYTDGDIVVTLDAPMVEGHLYIVVLSNEVEGKPGKPIVPSPVTVFLRTRGALVDNYDLCASDPPTAKPQAPGLTPADACQLEAGRQQFVALLDNETVTQLTTNANRPEGLTREIIAYLYGFEYTAQ